MENQITVLGITTKNFDICPGAVEAFTAINNYVEDMSATDKGYVSSALSEMDTLLALEKAVVARGTVSEEELSAAFGFSNSVLYFVGLAARHLLDSMQFLSSFSFMEMHLTQIMHPTDSINPLVNKEEEKTMKIKDGHTDVASALRQCRQIMEEVSDIQQALPSDMEASLPSWWTNKLAVSAAYLNSLRDYIVYSESSEELTLSYDDGIEECEVEIKLDAS